MRNTRINGNDFRNAMGYYAASLINRQDYAALITYYESNREELESLGGIEAGTILHRAAMAYASLSNYPAALKTARLAQHIIAQEGESELLAETFLTLGEILLNMGEIKEAERAFRDAESLFRRRDNHEKQTRALDLLAGLFYKQGDFKNSLALLLDALDIARKTRNNKTIAYLLGNVGRIYTFLGNFRKAEEHLKMNLELSRQEHDAKETARAYLALGYLHLQQARYETAREYLERADDYLDKSKGLRDWIISLSYRGELLYRTGELEEAAKALQNALQLAERISPTSTLAGSILRHLAEVSLRQQNHSLARQYVMRAQAILARNNYQVEIGALWKIKALIAQARSQLDDARRFFQKALDIFKETGVQFEEAETLLLAGTSPAFSEKQRLIYLFRAEEFYRANGIIDKLNEVERHIDSLDYSAPTKTPAKIRGASPTKAVEYFTNNAEIKQFIAQLPVIGRSELPLLLTGETGVGKDKMARLYHSLVRPNAPFVALNCSSFPETLLESELFGYRKGAFTGATKDKPGLFVSANGGVLFLDEIGDLPLSLQAKLLGVLETRHVIPLGSTKEVPLDIKIVAATNKDLEKMVEEGSFRRDLYYRLSGFVFHLPPLRERKEDIPLLLEHFLKERKLLKENDSVPAELVRQFVAYSWPGNIRELYNKVIRLEMMTQLVSEGDMTEISRTLFSAPGNSTNDSLFARLEQIERNLIIEALIAANGNKSLAARLLKIHEATMRAKIKRYGIRLEGGVVLQ